MLKIWIALAEMFQTHLRDVHADLKQSIYADAYKKFGSTEKGRQHLRINPAYGPFLLNDDKGVSILLLIR
jgi:hypothetical protein